MPKTSIDIQSFVTDWVADHVRRVPGLASVPAEMDRLAAELTRDARSRGISGRELDRTMGDIDDYLTEQYSRVCAGP
jgi:hypothetical protein